jgi:hypothetical protein
MAVELLRQKRGFERMSRQTLRGWEKSVKREAEKAKFMSTCDEAAASYGAGSSGEVPFPKAHKRGRKIYTQLEDRTIMKLMCESLNL